MTLFSQKGKEKASSQVQANQAEIPTFSLDYKRIEVLTICGCSIHSFEEVKYIIHFTMSSRYLTTLRSFSLRVEGDF